MVSSAWAVGHAMDYRLSCGNCNNGLPPDYSPPLPDSPPPSDTSASTDSSTGSTTGDSSGSICSTNVAYNMDYTGADISSSSYSSVADVGECCSLCQSTSDCYSWWVEYVDGA